MPTLQMREARNPKDHVMEDLNASDPAIQQLIAENNRLIELGRQAEQMGFEATCQRHGVDPAQLRQGINAQMTDALSEQIREALDQDRIDVQHEVDAEIDRRGLRKRAPQGVKRRGLRI